MIASSAPTSSSHNYVKREHDDFESPGTMLNDILGDVLRRPSSRPERKGARNVLLEDLLNIRIKEEEKEYIDLDNVPASPCELKLERIKKEAY